MKKLDRLGGPVLYRAACACERVARAIEENFSMVMNQTYQKHSTKWQPSGAISLVVGVLGLGSVVNNFGGGLGQETAVDSRNIRR